MRAPEKSVHVQKNSLFFGKSGDFSEAGLDP